jgi:2-oxoglutarate/2-oxoacid ferredoxin oxidoreductase subunit beta
MRSIEVNIDKKRCLGCGYCVSFCSQGCFTLDPKNLNERGFAVPAIDKTKKCSGCASCLRMCPHWAIQIKMDSGTAKPGQVIKTTGLSLEPPLSGCAGCQHSTVGRVLDEVIAELKCADKVKVLESIPCSISSVFGPHSGIKMALDENLFDRASMAKRDSPDSIVIAVQGYWGQADFSFDVGPFVNALIRGERISIIFCNTPYFGSRDMRPAPLSEPVEGWLEPLTQVRTPEGPRLLRGGYPLRLAEMVATFEGASYVARGTLASVKDYHVTRDYIRKALQAQIEGSGLGFVEVLNACCDQGCASPLECLKWIREKMTLKFQPGELKKS